MPANIVLSTLTPNPPVLAQNPLGSTHPDLYDGSRGGVVLPSQGLIFSDSFDDQPDWHSGLPENSLGNNPGGDLPDRLQSERYGHTMPVNWYACYQDPKWAPSTGHSDRRETINISATNRAAVVPTITAQPQPLTISQGADGEFTITGSNIATVEWTYDGVVVSGQSGTTLTITNAATGTHTVDGIAYSSEGGATPLDAAVLTVLSDGVLPVITLLGANPLQLIQGTAYSEPGYTATDDVDGDLTADVVVTGTVDHTTPNQYSLTYTVTDTAGNVGSRVRVVNVVAQLTSRYVTADIEIRPVNGVLCIGNDQLIVAALSDDNGDPITSGAVTLNITGPDGTAVSGITLPIALEHDGGGSWTAVIDGAVSLRHARRYTLTLSVTSGELDGYWREEVSAEYRDFSQ